MSKINSLGSQARSLFTAKMIAFAFQFLIPVVLARVFTVGDYGIYRQIITFSLIFPTFFSLGIENGIYYFFPTANNSIEKRNSVVLSMFLLLVSSAIFLIIFYFFNSILFAYWTEMSSIAVYSLPISLYIFFIIPALLLENLFIVEQNSKKVLLYTIVNGILRSGIIVIVALLVNDIEIQIWALVSFEALRTIFVFFYVKKNYFTGFGFIDSIKIKQQLKYSAPLGLGIAIGGFGARMESYMLLFFLSPTQFAIYTIANFRLPYAGLLYGAIANVALVRISEYSRANKFKESILLWHKAIVNQAAIIFPSVFYFIFMAPTFVVFLFSEKYAESVPFFQIILLAPLAQVFSAGIILSAFNYTNYTLRIKIAIFILALLSSYFLVKNYGLTGASISSVFTFYATVLLEIIVASRILKLKLVDSLPYKRLVIILVFSVITSLPLFYISALPFSEILKLLITAILFFTLNFLFYHRLKYLDLNPILKYFIKNKN